MRTPPDYLPPDRLQRSVLSIISAQRYPEQRVLPVLGGPGTHLGSDVSLNAVEVGVPLAVRVGRVEEDCSKAEAGRRRWPQYPPPVAATHPHPTDSVGDPTEVIHEPAIQTDAVYPLAIT